MTSKIQKFITQNKDSFQFNISIEDKEELSSGCINNTICNENPKSDVLIDALECIKILARDLSSEAFLCKEELWRKLFEISEISLYSAQTSDARVIAKHPTIVIEGALKVLCNMSKNFPTTIPEELKPVLVRGVLNRARLYQGCGAQITANIKIFDMKLLFLFTALFCDLRSVAIHDHNCLSVFHDVFNGFLEKVPHLTTDDVMLLCDILKCIFNVLFVSLNDTLEQKVEEDMKPLMNSLKKLVMAVDQQSDLAESVKKETIINTTNLLTSVPESSFQHLLYESDQESKDNLYKDSQSLRLIQLIINLIDSKLNENVNLLETLSPLMHAMGKACLSDRNIRKYTRLQVLPYMRKEVMNLPEQGNSIRNKLCKLLQHPCEQVAESVAFFLFVLCKEDVERAIKYTGFGNFAGFLSRHSLLRQSKNVENNPYSDSEDSDTEEYLNIREKVNPVTGRVEETVTNPLEGMTDEQKEYEVVRLMNQIDKLQKQGIIQPGVISDDGSVRPAESVLEIMEKAAQASNYEDANTEHSDDDN